MEKPITANDKFLKNMRQKYNTKEKDSVGISKITMEGILEGVVQIPEKLHMVSSPERSSVKAAKKGENQLHTGVGKDFSKSTMDK